MKFNYFLRGLGIGIIFGALIVFIASMATNKKMSDDEIIKKAEELGMVMETATSSDADLINDKKTAEEITSEQTTSEKTELTTEDKTTEDKTTEKKTTEKKTTEKKTTEKKTTEAKTTEKKTTEKKTTEAKTTEKKTTEKKTTEAKTTEKKTTEKKTTEKASDLIEVTITVSRGMGSTEVAAMLEKAGIVKSGEDFDNYLVKQGISDRIQINEFKFNNKMTYEEIANKLIEVKKTQ